MKKRLIAAIAVAILILTVSLLLNCFGVFNINPAPSPNSTPNATPIPTPTPPPTLIVPDDYPTINSAIANATDGYWIIVKNGTYNEQTLNINKTLTIISQYQNGAQIIFNPQTKAYSGEFGYPYETALEINSNNVTLSGFLITVHLPPIGQTWGEVGIGNILVNGNGAQILNNNMLGKEKISLSIYGNDCKVAGNSLERIWVGRNNNLIENNHIAGYASVNGELNFFNENHVPSIWLSGRNNTISSNQVKGGNIGIRVQPGNGPINYNIVWNNTIIVSRSGNSIGIKIDNGETGANIEYNFFGGNTISQANAYGIFFKQGNYNVFYGNIFKDCNTIVYLAESIVKKLDPSYNNLFFGNSFINNPQKVETDCTVNPYNLFDNGSMGNYWDTYSGTGTFPVFSTDSKDFFDNYPLPQSPGILTDFPPLPSPWNKIPNTLNKP